MRIRGIEIDYPRAVLAALVLAVVVAVAVAASTSGVAFGAYNPAWDGASGLRAEAEAVGAEAELVTNTTGYAGADPNGTVAVVLSPDTRYTDAEAARVARFVREGGTLVVAEDFGPHSNRLLAAVNASARVDGRLLRDERFNYRSPAMPVATNVSNATLTDGVEELTLNHGTFVRPNGATVLVATSGFAYPDANRNGELDDDESLGTYPVATVEAVGAGRVVVVGDPSLAINAMLDRPGNRAFVRNLFRRGAVLLDYSHAAGFPPLAYAAFVVRKTPLLQLLLGGLGAAAIGLWTRRELWERIVATVRSALGGEAPGPPVGAGEEELAAYVRGRHPDWEEERVRRVIQGVISRRTEPGDDD